ncbi:MAG: hypothetical protein ACPGVS_10545, partial [Primorskyibacter sp.]
MLTPQEAVPDAPQPAPLDAKLDRIRSALAARAAQMAPASPISQTTPAGPIGLPPQVVPSPIMPPPAVAPDVAPLPSEPRTAGPTAIPVPVTEDPSEQVLLDAKDELAAELAKIEAEILEERAKQERLRAAAGLDDASGDLVRITPATAPSDVLPPEPVDTDPEAGAPDVDAPRPEAERHEPSVAGLADLERIEPATITPDPAPQAVPASMIVTPNVSPFVAEDGWDVDDTEGGAKDTPEESPKDSQDETSEKAADNASDDTSEEGAANSARTMTRPQLGDTSVSRILEQTNWEMDKPEGNRRRSAIAHLRAAVAATRADRILGQAHDASGAQAAYREDLEDHVRPHPIWDEDDDAYDDDAYEDAPDPVMDLSQETPPAPRPTPLKLVAEQRVPLDEATA